MESRDAVPLHREAMRPRRDTVAVVFDGMYRVVDEHHGTYGLFILGELEMSMLFLIKLVLAVHKWKILYK